MKSNPLKYYERNPFKKNRPKNLLKYELKNTLEGVFDSLHSDLEFDHRQEIYADNY